MSLVNFITEHGYKSSLFKAKYKEFHYSSRMLQVHKFDSATLHLIFGHRPCTKSHKKPRHIVSSSVFLRHFDWY